MMYYIIALELFSAITFQREKRHVSTTCSKRNYAQIDKDDLTAITEDKKFHNYIYSLFEIRTDCKTHLGILSNNKPAPSVMSPQMQRWSVMLSTTAMITALRQLFITHLSPDTIVSDNGTAFTSDESKDFTKSNLIRAVTIAPCHRQANPSEQMVQTTKDAIMRIIKGDWLTRFARFLITQHITPFPSTRVSPAELLMEQCLKTWVHHLNYDLSEELEHKQDHALDSSLSSTLRFLHMTRKCICRSYGEGASPGGSQLDYDNVEEPALNDVPQTPDGRDAPALPGDVPGDGYDDTREVSDSEGDPVSGQNDEQGTGASDKHRDSQTGGSLLSRRSEVVSGMDRETPFPLPGDTGYDDVEHGDSGGSISE
ncbi:unnamed protein product [Caretta caretta]